MAAEDESNDPPEPTISARQRLVGWADQQDGWVRSIVADVLAVRRPLSDETLAAIRDHYLVEKQLVPGTAPAPPTLTDNASAGDATDPLTLTCLKGCDGVNALAAGQDITFNPRMTVLFGENAAGKTGYVRVLKLLADVRSAEAIIPDIHRPSAPSTPQAVVGYSVGSVPDELEWHGEQGVPPFTRMTVFDSPAVAIHLADDVTYVYTPADLALFGYVTSAIEGVRTLLQEDIKARESKQNPFISAFTRGTDVFTRIEALSASTNLAELETLATVSAEERTELDALKTSIGALTSPSGAEIEMLKNRAAILQNLSSVGRVLTGFDGAAFAAALETESTASRAQEESAAAVFGGGTLADELKPAWQRFIEAGEQYLAASSQAAYPETDDACIYCQQSLSDAARDLLRSYRNYASGVAAETLRTANSRVTSMQQPLLAGSVTAAIEGLRATLPGVLESDAAPDWAADGQALLARGEEVQEAVQQKQPVPEADESIDLGSLLPRLSVALAETDTVVQGLEGDAAQKRQLLAEQQSRLALLEARLLLAKYLPDIRRYVENAAWVDRLTTLLGRFKALLTGNTAILKLASEDALNHDFERVFYEECQALRAPTVALDFPGRRGQAARRKSVTRDHSLSDILSEGEQKVIAIADFLAEASLRTGSAPIIFDDPVNSLDHRRVREIAKRIADLSALHQVIVFTHDIWFATEVLAAFDGTPSACSSYQVREEAGLKGLISGEKHPRSDTVQSIGRRINEKVQAAEGGSDDDRQERIDSTYDFIRTWCERVVEHELLKKVAQRFQPNVAMQNLTAIHADELGTAIGTIYPIWEKACRYMTGHSQPLDTLGVRASVSELKQDWADLQQALKDYKSDE